MIPTRISALICMLAALTIIVDGAPPPPLVRTEVKSPCPQLFKYEDTKKAGEFEASLTLWSPHDLHGVWARVYFDRPVEQLTVANTFGEVVSFEDKKVFLIKNREVLLQGGEFQKLTIQVKYLGGEVPRLIEYRLNGVVICPDRTKRGIFQGDLLSKDYFQSLTSKIKPVRPLEKFECGTHTGFPASSKVVKGQWPWNAALFKEEDGQESFLCDATLISPKHLITAAHCVTWLNTNRYVNPSNVSVSLGEVSLELVREKKKLPVERVDIYPGYVANNLLNDIAIVKLQEPIGINKDIKPICLPETENENKADEVYIAGYGVKDGKLDDLANSRIEVISDEKCLEKRPDLTPFYHDNQICASYTQDNIGCVGGSGASIAVKSTKLKDVWELRSIVNIGQLMQEKYKCKEGETILAINVLRYNRWIKSILTAEN